MRTKSKKYSKTKLIICLGVILGLLVAGLSYYIYYKKNETPRRIEIIERRWTIDLPENMQLIYRVSSMGGFNGDGTAYTIFQLEVTPHDFLQNFNIDKNEDFEKAVNSSTNPKYNSFKVIEEYLPNWNQPYYWLHKGKGIPKDTDPVIYYDNSYFIFYPHSLQLIICEDLM